VIDFDVETRNLAWYAPTPPLFLAQFHDGTETRVFRHPHDAHEIQRWLDMGDDYRAWNTKFDLHHLKSAGYVLPPPQSWHDGMVLSAIADERMGNALQSRANNVGYPDAYAADKNLHQWILDERKRRRAAAKDTNGQYVPPNYGDVPMEIMDPYAREDVIQTRFVTDVYGRVVLQDDELRSLYEMEREVLAALFEIERRGLPIDRESAVLFEKQLLEDLERKTERLQKLAGKRDFNPNSSAQIEEALRRRGADLTFVSKTKSGKSLSMDNENLSAVRDELAEAVLDWRTTDRMYGTYVRRILHTQDGEYGPEYAYLGADDRIHPNYRQVGARHGRMSASDPNVQNWHRDDLRLRYLVQAPEGKVLISADLDAIEMRLFAGFAGEGPLLSAVREGRDMHQLAADMVGITEYKRAGGAIESARQRGKTFNYSMAYGAGARSVRKKYRYKEAFPEVRLLQETIAYKLRERGYIKTPWGRRQRVDQQHAYKGTNYLVSGTAADLFKDAVVRIHKAGVPIVGLYHDEVLAAVDPGDADEATKIITDALTDHPRLTKVVPIEAEANVVNRWSEAKDPNFRPAYAKD
jgi:DNA polymerase I-like protein with 3'-5' exonuclease and polymerase domains